MIDTVLNSSEKHSPKCSNIRNFGRQLCISYLLNLLPVILHFRDDAVQSFKSIQSLEILRKVSGSALMVGLRIFFECKAESFQFPFLR